MKILGIYTLTGTLITYSKPQEVVQAGEYLVDLSGQIVAVMDPDDGWLLAENLKRGVRTKVKVQTVFTF